MIRTGKAGKGTYGIVYNAETTDIHKRKVAVKRNIIDPSVNFSGSIKELDLLNRVKNHPYIVKLLSVSYSNPFSIPNSPISRSGNYNLREDYLHFIFEQADTNGHVLIYGNGVHIGYLKLAMVQMFLGIEYMHAKNVIHRDIKPANLLWFVNKDNKTSIKLCDFGLAKVYTKQGPMTPRVVTSWYRAPEICASDPNYTFSSDIWSAGCILFEMLSKKPLLQGSEDNNIKLLSKIIGTIPNVSFDDINKITNGLKITLTADASPRYRKTMKEMFNLPNDKIKEFNEYPNKGAKYEDFIDLLEHILVLDYDKRYTCKEILKHKFFEPYQSIINWSRKHYPPIKERSPHITIIPCNERRWACKIAFIIFNARAKKNVAPWYKHRIIFQSIDMFDRYIVYMDVNNNNTKLTESKQGKYISRYQAELRFLVCMYICIKYFTTLQTPISFTTLASDNYKSEKAMIEAEEFEKKMIREVLNLTIYRNTIYETLDNLPMKVNDYQIRDLLWNYGRIKKKMDNITPLDLYNTLVK